MNYVAAGDGRSWPSRSVMALATFVCLARSRAGRLLGRVTWTAVEWEPGRSLLDHVGTPAWLHRYIKGRVLQEAVSL